MDIRYYSKTKETQQYLKQIQNLNKVGRLS